MNTKALPIVPFTFADVETKITKLVGAAISVFVWLAVYTTQGQSEIKWNQPPDPAQSANLFYGWNQQSVEGMFPWVADDWVCTNAAPVTKIRWWGSFLNWTGTNVPVQLPGFVFKIWTNVPAGADPQFPGFSHPGIPLTNIICTTYTVSFAGWDYDPRSRLVEACFVFEQTLAPGEWFYQDPGTGTNIYWLSIGAMQSGTETYLWGWKTRPRDLSSSAPDDAVTFDPSVPWYAPIWWPDPTNSWDMAFELISGSSEGMESKWEQLPDLSPMGMDVRATTNRNSPQLGHLLADDFRCTSPTYVTNITIWGSLSNDFAPQVLTNIIFTLSIHDDIPDPDGSGPGYSMPGPLRWMRTFTNGQYKCSILGSNLYEGWYSPPSLYLPGGDTICYQYNFTILTNQAFRQEGTASQPRVYWLDVQALVPGPLPQFGWKTSITNWNDDAVWVNANEGYVGPWNRLTYPFGHPHEGSTVDLAFRLNGTSGASSEVKKWSQPPVLFTNNTFNGWNQYSVDGYQFAADDWACTNAAPVTDIHWWGSFIGWGETNPPLMPDAFTISIWTDVPQGVDGSFSHPDYIVHWIYCTNFTWSFAGWDFDPRNPAAPFETCFKFEQNLAPNEWFTQDPATGTNIYWLSIAAVYNNGPPSMYPWGWKTRPRDINSLAPDDAVANYPFQQPPWQPIWWPTENDSWDMAFVLTTHEIVTATNDFGDAPDPGYPTLLASNGARHTVVPGVLLGGLIDAELNGQPNPTATGDDATPPPPPGDEDGVTLTSPIVPGGVATIQVVASANGFLSAWFDFNGDGSWAQAGDQIFTNLALNIGPNLLSFNVPPGAPPGITSFARFRFSTVTNLTYTGQAPDGEVEDYMWYIEQLDYGDAPDPSYPTLLVNNGARHAIVPGVFLGNQIDAEVNGQPNPTATGDDATPPPLPGDEDGVTLWGSHMIPGGLAGVTVKASANGFLSAWVDFNVDGTWVTPGDQIFANVPVTNGLNNLTFNVPISAARGTFTFARVRFSTAAVATFTGLALDGEVEDYRWYLEELDFGDAPDPTYPTVYTNNGAFHWTLLSPPVYLGKTVDSELDGQPNSTATGDDANGVPDDEDGVTLATPLLPGQLAAVQVVAAMSNAYLNAWIDFGADGSWAQAGDQIANNLLLPVAGPNLVNFPVPANAAVGSNVFARFRFSTAMNLSYTNVAGQVPNGEVEDYRWLINALDFSDAPTNYPTLLANNGARHAIFPGFCLGSLEDGETDGKPNSMATGDDTNNLADEDGVVLVTPLVIGTQACVKVTLGGTNAGSLDGWIDFNTNGSWLDAGEKVINSIALAPGTNTLCFAVPASAGPGPTFARFRLSSAGGLSPTGLAPDGEVEDYRFTLGWLRPSTNIVITNIVFRSMFNGWNETSVLGGTNTVAADDWVCTTTNPITDIRWWGSFRNWHSTNPPTLPSSFQIVFWSDQPTNFVLPFSHPKNQLREIYCTNYTCQFVGWDLDPRTLAYEACFRFDQRLTPEEWFYQTNAPTGTNIYWLSIAAVYQQGAPEQVWGWKTRPRNTNSPAPDDAVRFIFPQGPYQPLYWPTPSNSWDLAFELVCDYTNVIEKWMQPPDLSTMGIDVNDTADPNNPPPYLLADDFPCTATGPLTDIILWGSWRYDYVPPPQTATFTLSIHADTTNVDYPWNSMPGKLLWTQTFGPGQYLDAPLPVQLEEWWLDPPGGTNYPGDHNCFQYAFHVATNAFIQTNGTIYWLDVQAHLPPGMLAQFGWKTTPYNFNWHDDAVWVHAVEPYEGTWNELRRYWNMNVSIDLSFQLITSQSSYQLKWSQPPLTNRCLTIEWNAENNVHYQVQATTNLAPTVIWTNLGPELIGPVHEQSDTDLSAPAKFYIIVAPNVVP